MMNRSRRSTLKHVLRTCNEAIARDTPERAEEAYRAACTMLDREADRGLIHRNAAARRKSRLALRLNAKRTAAPKA